MKPLSVDARIAQLEREVRKLRADSAERSGYCSLAAAATYLGISVETMKYYVYRRGLFTPYKIGSGRGHLLFRRADLDAYLETRAAAEPKPALTLVQG